MIEQIGNSLTFTAFYTSLGLGTTGLTVTVDVFRNGSLIVTGASAAEAADGLYTYILSSASVTVEGVYVAVFKTATTTVDQQHVSAAWAVGVAGIENLDASVAARPTAAQIDTQLSGTHGSGNWGAGTGAGATAWDVTITVSGLPREGVEVWVTTDSGGLNRVASGTTDTLGNVTFYLDPGTYYVWKQLAGVNFTNPESMVVT